MRKIFALAAGIAIAAGPVVVAPAAHAEQAVPAAASCKTGRSGDAPYVGYAWCTGLASDQRVQAVVTCVDPRGSQWKVYGPLVKSGIVSFAKKCSDNPNVGIASVSYRIKG